MLLPRAILFDLDGVLVRTEEAWFRTLEVAAARFHGKPMTYEEFRPTFGQGTVADIATFDLACTPTELDRFYLQEFLRHVGDAWLDPQARPTLEALARRGIARGVVTNSLAPIAASLLAEAFLTDLFDSVATSDRVARAKPAPDLVLLACRELGVSPPEAWVVGDSRFDREAARAAGAPFVGYRTSEEPHVDELAELLRLLDT